MNNKQRKHKTNERKELDHWVEYLRENPDCPCKLVVDSSAYSAWTRGLEINIDEYIAWEKIYAIGGSSFVKEAFAKMENK